MVPVQLAAGLPFSVNAGSVLVSIQLVAPVAEASVSCPNFFARTSVLLDVSRDAFARHVTQESPNTYRPTVSLEHADACSAQLNLQVQSSESAAVVLDVIDTFVESLPHSLVSCEAVQEIALAHSRKLITSMSDPEKKRKNFFSELRKREPNFKWMFQVYENMKFVNCTDLAQAAEEAVRAPKLVIAILRPDDYSLFATEHRLSAKGKA
jgi:hypothetical protein